MEENSHFEKFDDLSLNTSIKSFLKEIAKWANFLSIIGFIGIAFIVVFAVFFMMFGFGSSVMSSRFGGGFMGVGIAVFYLLIGLLYFMPVFYLNRFASNMKTALNTNDDRTLTDAFRYLKSHYKFIGIFTLVILGFYVLIFLFGILGAGMSLFH